MWIPLHVHSQYSILDASSSVEGIAQKTKALGIPAVALTDHGNLHGAVEFYKACKGQGVAPIIGCEFYVAPTSRFEKKKIGAQGRVAHHLILLAKNEEGYRNLCRLSSRAYLEGFYYYPRIDKELLVQYSKGLLCLSGCLSSLLASCVLYENEQRLHEEIRWHQDLFGEDYYLELQRQEMSHEKQVHFSETWLQQHYEDFISKQKKVNHALIEAGQKFNIKVVATNDIHYLEPEDWQAHEILLNIQSGEPVEIWEKDINGNPTFRVPNPKRRVYATHELYYKSPEEMGLLFKDIPAAISNTVEIAAKCQLELDFKTKHYPVFIPPELKNREFTHEERRIASEVFLRKLCEEGISRRYTEERLARVAEKYPHQNPLQVVRERLELEFELITSKGMCDYLLIVWDFINWAKKKGIPMGPGRGSGAGSIILFLIEITDIEPLRFHLFFERFINPERISYPDIDVDICMERRNEVIDYTVRTYGKENVAQIITFGTMKAKMTIKDVGRVLSVPLSKVNQIAKFVPDDLNMTLERALEIDPDLNSMYFNDEDTKRIIDVGKKLEGSIRNTGIHAAGLIICGEPLSEHIPICLAKDSEMAATQYSMKPVEMVGMLKIDFLGLKTLTCIQVACDAIERTRGKKIDWVNFSLEDEKAFHLLQQGRTLGVFQMESGGMQELARQLLPDRFEEIIAIGALYRPGPMDMIPTFINRKHKREPIQYDHPWLEPILEETYGIMVYQEQVMQIAQNLANYSLGEGDVLRRAMGKKEAEQMAKEREKFRKGALSNGISDECATAIFDQMEKFASYGFNKSHAAAYGFLTYVTAFLKSNYPKEWMAALMTCDRDDLTKVAKFLRECQAMQIAILPPDINEAGKEFVAKEIGIRFAMGGIKGIGEGVVDCILEERRSKGPFKNFYDFFKRIDLKKIGKKTIELLVDAGCFDFTTWSRDALKNSIEEMYETALREQKETSQGVMTLFSLMKDDGENKRFETPPPILHPVPYGEILKREKQLLGFFLTGHPMDAYRSILTRLSCVPLASLENFDHQAVVRSAFIVETVQVKIAQRTQKKFAILQINDGMETYELPIWAELFEEKQKLLEENQLLYAVLQIDKKEDTLRLACRWFDDLTKVDEKMIEACDKAFDKAKAQVSFSQMNNRKQEEKLSMKNKSIQIEIQTQVARLSHVLQLKEILQQHPGSSSVHIHFQYAETNIGTLQMGQNVKEGKELEEALQKIPSIKLKQA